jgi:hypothetical protein
MGLLVWSEIAQKFTRSVVLKEADTIRNNFFSVQLCKVLRADDLKSSKPLNNTQKTYSKYLNWNLLRKISKLQNLESNFKYLKKIVLT